MDFKKLKIEKRLMKGFRIVSLVASIAAVLGVVAMLVIANRYDSALKNYGFAQGEVGKALVTFADTRSSVRGIIGYDDMGIVESLSEADKVNREKFNKYWADVEQRITGKDERALYTEITEELGEYWEILDSVMEVGKTTDAESSLKAQQMAVDELSPMYDELYGDMVELMDLKVEGGKELESGLGILEIILFVVIVVLIVVGVLISNKLGRGIAKSIAGPLNALSERLRTFAKGNLSEPFPEVDSEDEVADMIREAKGMAEDLDAIINDAGTLLGAMADGNYAVRTEIEEKYSGDFAALIQAMRQMNHQMNTTLHQIGEASNQVSMGSENLADASQALAEGATDQAGSVEELQATFANITEGVQKTAEHVEESYRQAQKYAAEADKSRGEMEAMVSAMNRINETSERIENIISDIEDIASQTNLLSLNAAIEAARAGEAGKGFAVVADQIRKLAEQSAKSAVDTRQLIANSLEEIAEGNEAAERAAASIEEVVKGVKQIAESSRKLSEISAEQANAMEQAEAGVNQISEIIQSNSASAEESSATSQELSAQAVSMSELVGKFVLNDSVE